MSLKPSNYPAFLSKDSCTSLETFLADDPNSDNIPDERIDASHNLWKMLLGDAITYLKSTDRREYRSETAVAQRDVVAFGVEELHKYFEEYRSFEALLYGADRFYRDHIIHVFRVWLMGMWLIEQFGSSIHWDCDFEKLSIPRIDDQEIAAMWCVIALTHDLGYPLNKVEKVQEKINSMMRYFGGAATTGRAFEIPVQHHFINDFILKFIGSKLIEKPTNSRETERRFGTATQSKYYLKFSKSLENFDHGIISCILLMKNLVYFLESDLDLGSSFDKEDARQFYIRREILRTIACHTCTDIYHLQPNSLAFVLILADELQVWGRPTFQEIKSGRQRLTLETCVPAVSFEDISIWIDVFEERTKKNEEGAGKQCFSSICRKWHKWLRSALDAGNRKFDFCLEAEVRLPDGGSIVYSFESKPGNQVRICENGKEQSLVEFLYS